MNTNEPTPLHVQEDEKELLLEHRYDGIQELNHPLPNWWNTMFYAGIIYGLGYWIYYTFLGGPTLHDEYLQEMVPIRTAQAEYKLQTEAFSQSTFDSWNQADKMDLAFAVYEENCLQCHGENGRGDVGPNLTDDYWLLSQGTPETNYQVVYYGSEDNGMPAWGEVLSSEEIYQALVYINSLKHTFHPEGKEAEGEKVGD